MEKKKDTQELIRTADLRTKLKECMRQELAKLPEYLEELPTDQKVNTIIKIMPYVLPRVEAVEGTVGEGWSASWD